MPEHQQIQHSKKPEPIFQKQATPSSPTHVSNPFSIIQRAKINPKSLTHADVMQLQRTIGNRAVGRLLSGIGSSSIAQQATIQRQEIPEEETCPSCIQRQEIPEEEEPLQGKMIGTIQRQEIPEEEEPLQGKMAETMQRQEIPEEEPLQTKRENNTGMPDNLKAGVESLSGIDMSDVRVHYNSDKPAEVGALAYTQGTDIHVSPGQEKHLPHEAWHVVQQMQRRVKPTMQLKGLAVNDDVGLEQEADIMGDKIIQLYPRIEKSDPARNKDGASSNIRLKSDSSRGIGFNCSQYKVTLQRITPVELIKRKREEQSKHALMEIISKELQQNWKKFSLLPKISNPSDPVERAIIFNMALSGKIGIDSFQLIKQIVPTAINADIQAVVQELSSMPTVDPSRIDREAIKTFAHYTKEGYENVTGIAKGNRRFDKQTKLDRDMTSQEIQEGKQTLTSLKQNWVHMPIYTGTPVFRVLHTGTGEDSLVVNQTQIKPNPTSTSVSLDWSRVGEGKKCCQINIQINGNILPVDTRVVSTYIHEGEILLPPGTIFTKLSETPDSAVFNAKMPDHFS